MTSTVVRCWTYGYLPIRSARRCLLTRWSWIEREKNLLQCGGHDTLCRRQLASPHRSFRRICQVAPTCTLILHNVHWARTSLPQNSTSVTKNCKKNRACSCEVMFKNKMYHFFWTRCITQHEVLYATEADWTCDLIAILWVGPYNMA